MSADASGHAWRHAPYTGSKLLVLLAIADLVSDGFDNECWMSLGRLAEKSRCNRDTVRQAVRQFEEDGWVEAVERSEGGRASKYRFLFDDERDVRFEARKFGTSNPRPSRGTPAAEPRDTRGSAAGPSITQGNGTQRGDSSGSRRRDVAAERAAERRLGMACQECNGSRFVLTSEEGSVPVTVPCPTCNP